MKIKKELIKRDIAGDIILVPVGSSVYEAKGLFVMNELGGFIWDLLPEAADAGQICRAVVEEYDVSPAEAEQDIAEFLGRLRELDII